MPTPRRATLKPESAAELHLEAWEGHFDGLIFFDAAGNFLNCSPKMQKLAGSIDAARAALAESSWPGAFAASQEPVSISRQTMRLGPQTSNVEVRCIRTSGGFVAALALSQDSGPEFHDLLLAIFSAQILERRAISRHLHGALTQDLVALSLSLSGLREEGGFGLSEAIARVERCCRGVRALSYVLAPPSFLDSGLMETLAWYADVLRADAGVDFEIQGDTLQEDPPEEIKSLFFAALQHMAAAAIWHPDRVKVRLQLHARDEKLSIRIDCACRRDEPVTESPLIRERARTLGGSMRLTTNSEAATLEMSVPWSPAV